MKRLLVAMIVLLSAGMLFANGQQDVEVQEDVSLTLFYYKQEIKDGLTAMVDAFQAANPNVTIELEVVPNDSATVLKTKMVSGEAPEIIQLQSYANVFEFAEAGWLEDLTDEPVMAKVVDGAKNAVTYDGRQYALPMDLAGIGIIYNIDIFEANGLTPPATFSELEDVCAKLTARGITPFAGLFKANWSLGHFITMAHTTLAGEKLMPWLDSMNNGKGSYADPVVTAEMFKLLDFIKANSGENAAGMDWNEQQAAFAGEDAAMMIQGLWSYGAAIGTNPELNCGFIPFPVNDNKEAVKLYADTDSTFAVSATAHPAKKKAAKAFLEWLSTPEAVKLWIEECKLLPTFKGSDVSGMDRPFQELLGYMEAGKTNPWAFSMYPVTVFEDACKNGAQEYVFGIKNANQVIDYIDATWRQEVAQ